MNWKELRARINRMSKEELSNDVFIYNPYIDEFFGYVCLVKVTADDGNSDIIDAGNHFLTYEA